MICMFLIKKYKYDVYKLFFSICDGYKLYNVVKKDNIFHDPDIYSIK